MHCVSLISLIKMSVFDAIQKPKTVRITSPGEIIRYYYNCVVNYEAA